MFLWGEFDKVAESIEAIKKVVFADKNKDIYDDAIYTYTFIQIQILKLFLLVNSQSEIVERFSKILVSEAIKNDHGKILYWKESNVTIEEEMSLTHTVLAMHALVMTYVVTKGKYGLPKKEFDLVIKNIFKVENWDICEGVKISREEESINVDFFSQATIIASLLEIGISPRYKRIKGEFDDLREKQHPKHKGLWTTPSRDQKLPIWATYDALKAITEYTLRM